ncbi:MAG: peptidoglycan DD-metalloendopeptidase family protein [Lysobacterales bacterium]
MNISPDQYRNDSFASRAVIVLLILGLLLLSGCHRHYRPVQTSDNSPATIVKRQLNDDGTYYVRSGDTLYAIAFSYGLDVMEVAKLNGISSPYTIYPGQKIQLMPPSGGSRNTASSSGVKINPLKTPAQVTTRTIETKQPSSRETPAPETPTTAKSAPSVTAATPAASNSAEPTSWKWPADGRVIRGFVAGDPARNGLDIAGKEGQPITASAGGQVVYSGNGLIGYGELIIVKHSEKMLSAYAHNRVRLVKEGDQVWAGQKIAEMGRNSSDEQILHFEIRQLGKPVNPLTFLPSR